jgi:hypothetical protein
MSPNVSGETDRARVAISVAVLLIRGPSKRTPGKRQRCGRRRIKPLNVIDCQQHRADGAQRPQCVENPGRNRPLVRRHTPGAVAQHARRRPAASAERPAPPRAHQPGDRSRRQTRTAPRRPRAGSQHPMTALARDIHVSKPQRGLTDPGSPSKTRAPRRPSARARAPTRRWRSWSTTAAMELVEGRSKRSPSLRAPISSFSGGERYRVPIALRMGLAAMLAASSGIPADVLRIDEPTDLDKAGLGYLAELLATPASRRCSSPTRTSSSPRCPSGSSSSAPPTPLRARWP